MRGNSLSDFILFCHSTKGPRSGPIAIDPGISFGRPVVVRLGISTAVLAERLDAGESIEELASDYGLSTTQVEEAVLYERAASGAAI